MNRTEKIYNFDHLDERISDQKHLVAVQLNSHNGNITKRINFISHEKASKAISIPLVLMGGAGRRQFYPDASSFPAEFRRLKDWDMDSLHKESFKWLDKASKCSDIDRKASMMVVMAVCVSFMWGNIRWPPLR